MKRDELFYNSSQVVCEFDDIVIEELQVRHFYGDEALSDPEILIKPKQAWYDEYVLPFSDVLIDFKWSYSYNESEVSSIYGRELDRRQISFRWYLVTTMPNKLMFWFNRLSNLIFFRYNGYFWWKILPLTSFFLLGIALANVNSKKIQPLMKSFYFITQLQNQEISDDKKSELKKELDTLAYRRHLLFGHGSHIIVGPAFSFFLMAVRSKLNRLRYRCKLETLELSKDIETWVHPDEGWDKGEEIWTVIVEAGSKYKAKYGSDTYDIINDVPYSMALRVAGMWIRTHLDGKLWNEHDDDYLVYFNDHIYHQVWLPMPYPQWVEEEYPKLNQV